MVTSRNCLLTRMLQSSLRLHPDHDTLFLSQVFVFDDFSPTPVREKSENVDMAVLATQLLIHQAYECQES